MCVYFKLLN